MQNLQIMTHYYCNVINRKTLTSLSDIFFANRFIEPLHPPGSSFTFVSVCAHWRSVPQTPAEGGYQATLPCLGLSRCVCLSSLITRALNNTCIAACRTLLNVFLLNIYLYSQMTTSLSQHIKDPIRCWTHFTNVFFNNNISVTFQWTPESFTSFVCFTL